MEENGNGQLGYYLSSLDELGEILIDADKIDQVGVGVLRLTLGTIMASKGAIFLYNSKTDNFSTVQGGDIKSVFKPPKNIKTQLINYRHKHLIINNEKNWISGELKKYIKNKY